MLRKALQIEYRLAPDYVEIIGLHRTDRGSRYRGRGFTITKAGKSKEEFEKEVAGAVLKLLDGKE